MFQTLLLIKIELGTLLHYNMMGIHIHGDDHKSCNIVIS